MQEEYRGKDKETCAKTYFDAYCNYVMAPGQRAVRLVVHDGKYYIAQELKPTLDELEGTYWITNPCNYTIAAPVKIQYPGTRYNGPDSSGTSAEEAAGKYLHWYCEHVANALSLGQSVHLMRIPDGRIELWHWLCMSQDASKGEYILSNPCYDRLVKNSVRVIAERPVRE